MPREEKRHKGGAKVSLGFPLKSMQLSQLLCVVHLLLNPPGSMPFIKDGGKSVKFEQRIEKAVGWLEKCKNLNFEALYFEEPDKTTHDNGADSNKTKIKGLFRTALSRIDLMLGSLIRKLNESSLLNETNIIVIGKPNDN